MSVAQVRELKAVLDACPSLKPAQAEQGLPWRSPPTIERVSESRRGIPAFVRFGCEPYAHGRDLEPERVEHAQLGITWQVTAILDRWQHPGHAEEPLGQSALTNWWLLKVAGRPPSR